MYCHEAFPKYNLGIVNVNGRFVMAYNVRVFIFKNIVLAGHLFFKMAYGLWSFIFPNGNYLKF